MSSEAEQEKVENAFNSELNVHGYGFQHALIEHVKKLRTDTESKWYPLASEFPVQVQGYGTRIDVILQHGTNTSWQIIGECKRANPALSNWCFVRSPFIHRDRFQYEPVFVECVRWDDVGPVHSVAVPKGYFFDQAYHIAIEVKSDVKGDVSGKGRGAIEEAATQVCRGLNGWVEFLFEGSLPQVRFDERNRWLLPVIFTTARIWSSDIDLRRADIATGKVLADPNSFKERSFIFYQYQLSPGIKHRHSPKDRPQKLGDLIDSEFVRTIAIVNPAGLQEFLLASSNIEFW